MINKKGQAKCNFCRKGKCYVEPNNTKNIEVKCNNCGVLNFAEDLIPFSQWLKDIKKNQNTSNLNI